MNKNHWGRRHILLSLGAFGTQALVPTKAWAQTAAPDDQPITLIGAAWRGPNAGDPYYAGVLAADWAQKKLQIHYALPLPGRPHGLVAEAGGGLLVNGLRPGTWLLRCDGEGRVQQQVDVAAESRHVRLSGHIAVGRDVLYTTEINYSNDEGRIGVRDRRTLRKLDEWSSGGIEPHQALIDEAGHLLIANGGIPRTLDDKKYGLERMDASLVRLDGSRGQQLQRWKLDDPYLSLRHLAWSHPSSAGDVFLGVAMQAEHANAAQRAQAPILAVLDGETLHVPARNNDGYGYAGDIAPAYRGGFALSSNKAGVAQVWHPGLPDKLSTIIELKETYALADWPDAQNSGGIVAATAFGLVRWHPTAKAVLLPWPKPMALDNHWVAMPAGSAPRA